MAAGFVKFGRGSFKHLFTIRAKSKTPAGRKQELTRFNSALGKLAKKFKGKVRKTR